MAYQKHLDSQKAGGPLTERESLYQQMKAEEVATSAGPSLASSSVTFPMKPEAVAALKDLAAGKRAYVQLLIEDEKTALAPGTPSALLDSVASVTPTNAPRYHFIRLDVDGTSRTGTPCLGRSSHTDVPAPSLCLLVSRWVRSEGSHELRLFQEGASRRCHVRRVQPPPRSSGEIPRRSACLNGG